MSFEGPALDQAVVQGAAIKPSDVADVVVVQHDQDAGDASLGWWGPLDHQGLSMVQRVLLTTDGTVTRTLEACAGEPMELVKLSQSIVPGASAGSDLGVADGDDVLFRRILMRGAHSGRHHLYAESLIAPSRLHPRLRHGLYHSDAPIGRLLWEHRVETVRELVRWGLEPAGGCASYFDMDPRQTLVSRTYRVVSQRQPIMLITEKLPADSFPD
jgi:chorismate-pyruvate lyase